MQLFINNLFLQKLLNMILLNFVRLGFVVEPATHGGKIDADFLSKLLLGDSILQAVMF